MSLEGDMDVKESIREQALDLPYRRGGLAISYAEERTFTGFVIDRT